MPSHDRHPSLVAHRQPAVSLLARRYLALFQALFILILLGSQVLSSLIYAPPVLAAGHPTPPVAHGNLTFQQFLKQGRPDGVYHGSFILPRKSPPVPITKGKSTDYAHLPPSAELPTMTPIAQSLTTAFLTGATGVAPLDLKGSDGRLEIQLQPGSLDLSHAMIAKGKAPTGPLTLHITQQYGNFSAMVDTLGTYSVEVLDSMGQVVSGIVLRTPATFVYHYRPDELHNLDLDADHLNMTWPGLIAAAKQARQVTASFLIPLHHDPKAHTLSGQSSVLGGILSMGNGSSSEQSPPVPHLATMQGNTGQLSYSYPLQIPPGPGGFAPQLTLAYSSAEPNGRTSRTSPASDIGDGWFLSLGSVTADNYPTGSAGAGTWYFLNDAANISDRLIPNPTPTDPNNPDFQTEHISQLKVIEANANTSTPCFKVWDTSGTFYEFGCTSDSRQYYWDSSTSSNVIYRWDLDRMMAPNEGPNTSYRTIMVSYLQDIVGSTHPSVRDAAIKQITYGYGPQTNQIQNVVGTVNFYYSAPFSSAPWATTYPSSNYCTNPAPPVSRNGLRCDDPQDNTSQNGLPAPLVLSTLSLNAVTSYVGTYNGNSTDKPAYRYDFTYQDSPFSSSTDGLTGNPVYVAGEHLLTKVVPSVYQLVNSQATGFALPPILFSYNTNYAPNPPYSFTNTYYDSTHTVTINGQSQNYSQNTNWQYLTEYSDTNTGIGEWITYGTAYGNTDGTPNDTDVNGNLDDRYDPLHCPTYNDCTGNYGHPDDRSWTQQVVTSIISMGSDSGGLGPSSITYHYRLAHTGTYSNTPGDNDCYPSGTDQDCVGDNWTPLNAGTGKGDSDWADYYHAEFHGFNVVYTTSPAGDVTADSYFSTKGWSTANSDASNYNTGHLYEEDVYSGNNANGKILRTTLYQYTGTCHVDNSYQGCTTYPNSCHGTYDATYNPCEVMVLWSKTFGLEGSGTYQTNTSAPLVETDYTYDDFNPNASGASGLQPGYHNLLEEDIIPSNAPEVKKFWSYVTNDTTTPLPWTYYIVNTVAHSEIDDTSGHIYQCQSMTYDEGASSSPSAGWPTTVSQYDNSNCKDQTNPLVTTYKGYDGYGNVVTTVDGTAIWAAANGNNLYGSGVGCSASPTYKTSHWSSNYTTCTTYDSYNAQPATVTQAASGTVNLTTSFTYDDNQGRLPISTTDANSQQTTTSYSYDSTGNSIVKVSQPGETANYTTKSKTNTQCATALPANGNTFASPCFEIDSFVAQYSNTVSQTFYDSQGREVETSTPVIPPSNADQTKTYFRVVITAYDDSTHSVWQSQPFVVASSTTVSSVKAVGWIDPGVLNGVLKDYNGNSVYGSATYDDALGRTIAVDDPIFNAGGSNGITCPSYGAKSTSCAVYSTGTITSLVSGDSNNYAITTSIDPNNHVQLAYSDALGRTRYVQFDSGTNSGTLSAEELKTIQYNILNEPTSVQVTDLAPHNNQTIKVITTTAQYDDLGRMTSLADPDRGTHTYSYDPDGHVIGDTSGLHVLGYSYDLAGRLGCLQDVVLTASTINASGNCGSGVNPFVINTYDADPGGVTWGSADYPKGRLTQSFAINYFPGPDYSQGKVTQNMQYDLRGRLVTERQNETITGGNLILPALPQNQMTLTYNDANQLMMTQTSVGGATGYTFSQAYDSKSGMLTGLSNNSNGVANLATLGYFYNSQGLNNTLNFLSSTASALATENFSYDGDLRPAGGNASWQSGSGSSGTIFSQGIGYDAAGNVLSQTMTMSAISGQSGSGGSETQNFCYDELNRLTWASNSSATPAAGSGTCGSVALQGTLGGSYTNTFKYTNLGQLWKGTLNGSGSYQYLYCNNNTHQLTAVTTTTPPSCSNQGSPAYTASYDSWGNITSRTYNSVTSTLAYDGQDHLVRWNGSGNQEAWYWYDASGNRVMTRSTSDGTNMTLTVYAFGLEEHQYTYSGSGSATNTANTYYYSLSGRLLGVLSGLSSQTTSFLLTDLLGSVVTSFSTTAGSATVQGNQAYGPFGNQRYSAGNLNSASSNSLTSKGYTGQYADSFSGLDYYNARYYDPVVGLFVSADKKQGNLQGMNPYGYVGDNPETDNDPTGQMYAPGTGGGEGVTPQELSNDAVAFTNHTAPAGGYNDSTLPWLLYLFLYRRPAYSEMEAQAQSLGYSLEPLLGQQASSYLALISASDWNANDALRNLHTQLTALSTIHMAQMLGDSGLEGHPDLSSSEEALNTKMKDSEEALAAGCSFTGNTLVSTDHGKEPIGKLYVGEKVLAYNPKTKKMEYQPILHVFLDHDNDLVDLTLTTVHRAQQGREVSRQSEVIHTNKKHPFFTQEKGFLSVGQIKLGMHVLRANGLWGIVTRLKMIPGAMTMYNLEVARDHTYAVGIGQWVVHNTGGGCGFLNEDGTLLNYDKAQIDPNKIYNWSLKDPNKSEAFQSALGYNQSNAESLIQQIQDDLGQYQAVPGLVDKYGSRFSVTMSITGPNGRTANVLTAWIYDPGSDIPRLVSAYVH